MCALFSKDELINNPTARIPVCLCLDTSGSMFGDPILELNNGVKLFFNSIKEDEVALYSAEIAIITFGAKGVVCERDFSGIFGNINAPLFIANGNTPMGEAVNLALDKLTERKQAYKDCGVDYYQPWLVLMTDGQPNGIPQELERSVQRTVELVNSRKLTVFPIGIGRNADLNTLSRYSPNRTPLRLKGLCFKEFFAWLSKSVSAVSQSLPGEHINIDFDGIKGWAEL